MAFLQSGPPRQPIFRAPPVVLWLIAGIAALHVGRVLQTPARADALIDRYAFIPARYSEAFLAAHHIDPGSWWDRAVPFLSYMGLHNDFTHLIVNSLFLLAFGPIVARRFGSALFLVFFLVCGVLAASAYLVANWGDPTPVIGASGGISGLMAAALRMLPTQIPWAIPGETPLAPIFSRQIIVFTLLLAAINIIAGLSGFGFGEPGHIAWQAHLGGYGAGLLLAGLFDFLRPRPLAHSLTEG